jgi:glycosyltransferase involved in cell wall biosynthesis
VQAVGSATPGRIPIVYLAPWIDFGGTDKNTIDWFRFVDRERFAPSLITTQPSANRRLDEVAEYAEEIWVLPDLMAAEEMPAFILDFVVSRKVQVVHLMNSRLGFDLLPDITGIADAPGIVVQLHVEERDRSGYVRYVTTRYGNLVDRFSVTSEHLAAAVEGYGVPQERTKVVYIGVDAEEEFSPQQVEPVEGLDDGRLHVLFPARIVQQKDPLLMVEVAAALRDRGVDFQVHVLGEGDLEGAVRERVAALSLGDQVKIHPPTATPQRWYAACDALLLTSEFEGVPAVVFEAMAMGLPVVAAALPGHSELLGEDYDGLVEPRDSVERYVEELAKLAEDRSYKESHGQELRERAREHFSLELMAGGHAAIYEEVAADGAAPEPEPEPLPEPLRFRDRPVSTEPLVSVLIPHYNQARFLGECVNSVWAQTYPNVEIVVVDDCSTEHDTAAVLAELEEQDDVTVLRLERNGGPSRARNRGLEHCSGRYVLPLDADNQLLPEAIEILVEQLSTAGEDVGFVYPKLQFFGNREDHYEPPPYNVYTLFHGNFCDTCSLIDRQVFDAGLRYREEILLGHEDWEFVLRLAAHGVRGEAAHTPTLRYRKWGFNRSDAVDHAHEAFDEELRQISPFAGREEEVKAAESPALTIALLREPPGGRGGREALARRLGEQSCIDVELIAPFPEADEEPPPLYGPRLRRLPAVGEDPAEVLRGARQAMRGRYLLVSEDPEATFLEDRGFVEKLLRRFTGRSHSSELIAFADVAAEVEGRFSFRGISAAELAPGARAHAVAWATAAEGNLPHGLQVDRECPAHSLVRLLSGNGAETEWRHAASSAEPQAADPPGWTPAGARGPDALANVLVEAMLPGHGRYTVPRWEETPTWIPPLSTILVRYREPMRDHWLITNGLPPFGYGIERHLGVPRSSAFEGTGRLIRIGEEFQTLPRGEWGPLPPDGQDLGYLEVAALPQMKVLALGVYRPTGQQVLVTLPDDPLLAHVDVVRTLGSIDPIPIEPAFEPPEQPGLGLRGLVKTVDLEHRRHRYAIGEVPPGQLVGELGAMAESELQGSIATWIVDGQLVTERHSPPLGGRRPLRAARWILEPAVWTGIAGKQTRVKSALRRSAIAAGNLARPQVAPPAPNGQPPAGWLFPDFRPSLSPLYASYHPVTEDQLLTRSEADAAQLGYDRTTLLGFIRRAAPVTGTTQQALFPIPWARRFGAVPRED